MKSCVHVRTKDNKKAVIEGAEKLGVEISEVEISKEKEDGFIISLKNAPGQFEIETDNDKMRAILRELTPPSGNGAPVTSDLIEKTLSDMGIVYGIEPDTILNTLKKARETGETISNTVIARGTPPEPGTKGNISLKTVKAPDNSEQKAYNIVKPGQVIAVKISPTPGKEGKNIFGESIHANPGPDIEFQAGENVTTKDNGQTLVSEVYGAVRETWQGVSVTDFVKISSDRMLVEMDFFPVLADKTQLSFDDILEILKSKGIKYGIKVEQIKTALEKGTPVEKLKVAEGTPPKNGIDAKIEFRFRVNNEDPDETTNKSHDGAVDSPLNTRDLVLGGDLLAVKTPPAEQEDGKTVTGETLKGIKPNDRKIRAGNNVVADNNELKFFAAENVIAGYADFSADTISVHSPLYVSEDKLSASITVHPPSSRGKILTLDMVKKIIAEAGITYGIDLNEIETTLSSTEDKDFSSKNVAVAKGKAAVNGKDAFISLKFESERKAGSIIEKTDRMDFKDQSFIVNVKKDTLLAKKTPFTSGDTGKNIFGEEVPAALGKDRKIAAGSNVTLSENGLTMTADIDGMVVFSDGNKISVLKKFEIPGDIDMHTGNIIMDGSLFIKGWIRAGFSAQATGEIHVGKGIEQAAVEADADMFIKGGILGSEATKVISGANITASFLENANVHARGDIKISDDIRHSNVTASGRIIVTAGKGQIIGGTVNAFKGITANKTGSSAGIKTILITGFDPELTEKIKNVTRHLEEFQSQKAKIDMHLIRFKEKYKSSQILGHIQLNLNSLLKHRQDLVQKEQKLSDYREDLLKKEKLDINPPSIKINNIVYAGTRIIIGKIIFDIEEDIAGKVRFVLDSATQRINVIK